MINTAFSQIQFDSVSTARFYNTFDSTLTISHTCSGTNRVLVVSVMSCGGVFGSGIVSSVTYDGTNMNLIVNDSVIPGLYAHNTCWYLSNPTSGTHSIIVKFADKARSAIVGAFSFNGANTSSPIGALISSSANGPSVSLPITTTKANSIIVDFVGSTNGVVNTPIVIDTNQIVKYNLDVPSNDIEGAGGYRHTTTIGTFTFSQSGYSGGAPLFGTALELIESPASSLPIIVSPTYSSITDSSAILGGNITSNGGCSIISRGICWGTTSTTLTNCVNDIGLSTGPFTMTISGLPYNTVIYYKAFVSNCVGTSYTSIDNFTTNQPIVGISETIFDNSILLFPNPSNGQFTLVLPSDNAEIVITDIIGKQLMTKKINEKSINIELDKNGLYIIYISTNHGTITRRLTVNR